MTAHDAERRFGAAVDERPEIELDPEASPGYVVRDMHLMFAKALRARLQPYRLTPAQWYFLRMLWIEEGLSQRELSRRVGMTEPTTVSALRLMERNGLVRRVRNASDRRTINIFLTDRAKRLRNELLPFAIAVNDMACRGIPAADMEHFRAVIRRMRDNMAAALEEKEATRQPAERAARRTRSPA